MTRFVIRQLRKVIWLCAAWSIRGGQWIEDLENELVAEERLRRCTRDAS